MGFSRGSLESGERVRLDTVTIGGTKYSSREAIQRFIEAQNAGDSPSSAPTKTQRAKQSANAKRELAAMGVM